jgi:putative ABC transport system permease protein
MLMNALERTREIGTLLALGARRSQIAGIFLLEAACLGGAGGAAGAALGGLAVSLLHGYALGFHTPGGAVLLARPTAGPLALAGAAALGLVVAALAGLYPALRASRLRPAEALASA